MRFVIQLIRSTTLFFRWTTIFRVCVALYMIRFPNGFGPNHTFNIFNILKMEIKKERTNVNKNTSLCNIYQNGLFHIVCAAASVVLMLFFSCVTSTYNHMSATFIYLSRIGYIYVPTKILGNIHAHCSNIYIVTFVHFFYEKSLTLHVFSFTGCKWAFLHSVRHTIHLLIFEWLFLGDLIDILFSSLSHKHTHTHTH